MPSSGYRTIVVADDHPIYREGLSDMLHALYPDARIWQAGTFDEMLASAREAERPDIFVLDLCFPGMDLARAVPQLRREFANSTISIISMADDKGTIDHVMTTGVDGFISKAATREQMCSAFQSLQEGEFVVIGGGQPIVPRETLDARFPDLTARQRDVLRHVCDGKSNKEIARILAISPFTVRIHVSSLLRALRVDTRAALAAVASRLIG